MNRAYFLQPSPVHSAYLIQPSPLHILVIQIYLCSTLTNHGTKSLRIGYVSGSNNGGAISMAVEKIQAEGLLSNTTVRYIMCQ